MYSTPPNPNVLRCDMQEGEPIAAPLNLTSDCWDDGMMEVVVRGVSPAQERNIIAVTVKPRYRGATLPRQLSARVHRAYDDSACVLDVTEPVTGLSCIGSAVGVTTLDCTTADARCCKIHAMVPEEWGSIYDVSRRYADEFPADDYPDN